MLSIPLVTLGDLEPSHGRLRAVVDGRALNVDVVYRRTDEDRLTDESGEFTEIGAALYEPLRAGTLVCVNGFGTGVADDKLMHAYIEEMIRFYLDEEPLLPSVHTYDLGDDERRAEVLDRLDELVVKPRTGQGGEGVVVGPPTLIEGRLEPRHVDLRPFVFLTPGGGRVLPGGLTRVALDRDALVVNSSQRGGAKDTWVLP